MVSDQISELANQVISNLGESIGTARDELSAAVESAKVATSDIKASSDALLETNEAAKSESKRQNEETAALLEDTQKHLADIDASIAVLKEIDVDSLAEEVRELKTVEANNVASLKSKLTTVTVMAGASIVLCIAVLAKLLVG